MDWKTKHDELMDDFKAVQGDRDRYCMLAKNMKVLAQGYKVLADGYKADLEGVKAERDALRGKLERVRNQLGSYLHGMERRHVEDQWHEAQFDAALAALSDDAPAPTEPLGCNCLHECPSEEERSGGAECVHDADCVLSAQPDPTPRYDEVFHDGTAWLDKQAELDEWPDPAPSAEPSCDCHFRDGELTWPCLWHKRDLERRVAQAREEALEEAAVMADRIDDMLPMSSGIPDAIRALKGGGR